MVSAAVTADMTVGEISRLAKRPKHRIEYVIKSRGIAPCRIAGAYRIFSEADVAKIIAELREIEKTREAAALRRMDAEKGVAL